MEANAYLNQRREKMLYNRKATGEVIYELRSERKMSQEVLSGLAEISRSHLSMIENGQKNANVDTLWKIAGALDLPLSDLMRRVEEKIRNSGADE